MWSLAILSCSAQSIPQRAQHAHTLVAFSPLRQLLLALANLSCVAQSTTCAHTGGPLPALPPPAARAAVNPPPISVCCRENGITLVAYSPLCQGLLTGKYSRENRPTGPRAQLFTDQRYKDVEVGCAGQGLSCGVRRTQRASGGHAGEHLSRVSLPPLGFGNPRCNVLFTHPPPLSVPPLAPQVLLGCMRAIAAEQGGKTLGQVAINWTLCKGALPIPGAKNAKQARAGAGWATVGAAVEG